MSVRPGISLVIVFLWVVSHVVFADDGLRLIQAVKNKDHLTVQSLIEKQADVNEAESDGGTPLHWAVYRDDAEVVGWLLEAGALVDTANIYGVTVLSLAAGNGNAEIVGSLLEAGADPNQSLPSGETPLMTASNAGGVESVRTLIAWGAKVDLAEASQGQTALMWALSEGHLRTVQILISHGADVSNAAASGFTPLMFASRRGDVAAVRMLLAHGADPNVSALDGTTALLVATVRGYPDLVRFLLDQGADSNAFGTGYTPLHWAAGSWETELTGTFGLDAPSSQWGVLAGLTGEAKLGLVRTLLAFGADPNVRTDGQVPRFGFSAGASSGQFYDTSGATPFLLAAQAGDVRVMKALLAAGADPLVGTDENSTPLMQASGIARVIGESHVTEAESLEIVKLMVDLGVDVNAFDNSGSTALHGAASQGFNTVVEFLVKQGADLDVRNEYGETPWTIAAGMGLRRAGVNIHHPSTAEMLRALGADTR